MASAKEEVKSQKSKVKSTTQDAKIVAPKIAASKAASGFAVTVYSLLGKEAGSLDLPKEIFGAKINEKLLSQAMRVYMNNLKGHYSNTKTRGEVTGSTRKIYAQKGTGRARHGGITAPIFVGGGIALGPKVRNTILDLPQKMKHAALIAALSQKMQDKQISALSGLDKATGKSKEIAQLLGQLNPKIKNQKSKNTLIVTDQRIENVTRAAKNLTNVELLSADSLNAFEVIRHTSILLTKEAVEALQKRFAKKEKVVIAGASEEKKA